MGVLMHVSSGIQSLLGASNILGRSPACQLRIESASVSGVHAELTWDGAVWVLHDLGSRNGTWVDGRKLEPGERVRLEAGASLGFGSATPSHRLVDVAGPALAAIGANGEQVHGEDGFLCLPSVEACELSIFYRPETGHWIAEGDSETRVLDDQCQLVAGGQAWRVVLPAAVAETRELSHGAPLEPTLDEVSLEFFVSRDSEHIAIALTDPRGTCHLDERAHALLLFTLAQARLKDGEQPDLVESEHGWIYREDLCKMLALDIPLLNLWVHRSRRQLARAGIRAPGRLVERRSQAQQLRIGVSRLVVTQA